MFLFYLASVGISTLILWTSVHNYIAKNPTKYLPIFVEFTWSNITFVPSEFVYVQQIFTNVCRQINVVESQEIKFITISYVFYPKTLR